MYLNFKFVLCGRSYESKNQETYQWCLYQCLVAIVVIEKKENICSDGPALRWLCD